MVALVGKVVTQGWVLRNWENSMLKKQEYSIEGVNIVESSEVVK